MSELPTPRAALDVLAAGVRAERQAALRELHVQTPKADDPIRLLDEIALCH